MFDLSDVRTWFLIFQSLFLILAVIFILLQNRGAGLSSSFGGSDEIYLTRRGIEKSVVTLTVVCISLFGILRIGSFYLPTDNSTQNTQEESDFDLSSDNQQSSDSEVIDLSDNNNENIQVEDNSDVVEVEEVE